jgi:Zn-dependent protease
MTEVVFRPRIAAWVSGAVVMTLVSYAILLVVGRDFLPDYPFGIAALIGGANLGWNLIVHGRKHALRADAAGITDVDRGVTLAWPEIAAIRLEVIQVRAPGPAGKAGPYTARIATLEGAGGVIRFGDLGPGRPGRIADVVNLPSAALLLAVITARTGATALYPADWTAAAAASAPAPAPGFDARQAGGVGVLAVKAGPKLLAIVGKLAKLVKLGSVALAVGTYALIWSWQFGVALVGMVLVHECGHAYAMWRSGVPVKGIYIIPFFGGAAVSRGIARTRARTAYIAINGPIWGTALAAGCFALYALGDGAHPLLGALAAWGALINLFNLLPIFPLDGGRIVASLAHASRRGLPVVAASLALGAGVAYVANLQLLMLVTLLGLLEFAGRAGGAILAPVLALAARDVSVDDHEHFARHVAFVERERDAPDKLEARRQLFARAKAEAEQTPMTARQGAAVLAGYLAVVGALVAILVLTASIAGTGNPLDLLK